MSEEQDKSSHEEVELKLLKDQPPDASKAMTIASAEQTKVQQSDSFAVVSMLASTTVND